MSSPLITYLNTHFPSIHHLTNHSLNDHLSQIDSKMTLPNELDAYLSQGEDVLRNDLQTHLDKIHTLVMSSRKHSSPSPWLQFRLTDSTSPYPTLLPLLHHLSTHYPECLIPCVEQIIDTDLTPLAKKLRGQLRDGLRKRHWGWLPSSGEPRAMPPAAEGAAQQSPKNENPSQLQVDISLSEEDLNLMEQLYILQCVTWHFERMLHRAQSLCTVEQQQPGVEESTNSQSSQKQYFWFIEELVEPFLTRFSFHFTGKKQTNSIEHPEMVTAFLLTICETYSESVYQFSSTVVENGEGEAGELLEMVGAGRISDDSFHPYTQFSYLLLHPIVQRFSKQLQLLAQKTMQDHLPPHAQSLFIHIINELIDMDIDMDKLKADNLPPLTVSPLQELINELPWMLKEWIRIDRLQLLKVWKPVQFDWNRAPQEAIDSRAFVSGFAPTISTLKLVQLLESLHERSLSIENLHHRAQYIEGTTVHLLNQYLDHVSELEALPNVISPTGPADQLQLWADYCRKINSIRFMLGKFTQWSEQEFLLDICAKDTAIGELPKDDYELTYNHMLKHIMEQLLHHMKNVMVSYNDYLYGSGGQQNSALMVGSKTTHTMFLICTRLRNLLDVIRTELNQQDMDILWSSFTADLDGFFYTEYMMGDADVEIDDKTVVLVYDLEAIVDCICDGSNEHHQLPPKYFPKTTEFCNLVLSEEVQGEEDL